MSRSDGHSLDHLAKWIVVFLGLLVVAMGSVALVVSVARGDSEWPITLTPFLYAFVGVLLVWRRPKTVVAWLLLSFAALWAGTFFGSTVATLQPPGDVPPSSVVVLSAWLSEWTWLPALLVVMVLIPLLFPTGKSPGRSWRWLTRATWSVSAVFVIVTSLQQVFVPNEDTHPEIVISNPWALLPVADAEEHFIWVLFLVLLGVWAVVYRYRRAPGEERQQLRWFVYGVVVTAALFFLNVLLAENVWLALSALAVLPMTIWVAITRHRLYELDRVISRTASYGLIITLLGLLVAGIAAIAGTRFEEPWVVAATTLGIAWLFNPLRIRVHQIVDRRFNRSRYDAGNVMDEFAESLRDEVDPDGVVEGWVDVVSDTMQPAAVGVWVRK